MRWEHPSVSSSSRSAARTGITRSWFGSRRIQIPTTWRRSCESSGRSSSVEELTAWHGRAVPQPNDLRLWLCWLEAGYGAEQADDGTDGLEDGMRSVPARTPRRTLVSIAVTVAALGWGPTQAVAADGPLDPLLGAVAETTSGAADLGDPVQGPSTRPSTPFPARPIPFLTLCPTPWTRSLTRRPTRSKASLAPPPGPWTPSPTLHPEPIRSPARPRMSPAESRTPSGRPTQA